MNSPNRFLLWLVIAGINCWAQNEVDLRTQSKNVDFSGAASTKPFRVGAILPANCSVGEAFFLSNAAPAASWYACIAANTWAAQAGSGGNTLPAPANATLSDFRVTRNSSLQLTVLAGTYRVGRSTRQVPGALFTIQPTTIASTSSSGGTTNVTLQTAAPYRTGDSINIQGAQGCTGLNGLWLVTGIDASHFNIPFDSSGCTYTANSGTAGANTNATGSVNLYADSTGILTLEHPTGAGLLISCAGPCVTDQTSAPGFPPGSVPIAIATVPGGNWDPTITDQRAFLSNGAFVDGIGIASTDFGGIRVMNVDATVARMGISNTWTGDNDFSAAPSLAIKRSPGVPAAAACSSTTHVGRLYERADTQAPNASLYVCSQSGSGSYSWELAQLGPWLGAPADGGLKLNSTTQPACDATHRGTIFYTAGAAGVKDTVQVCAKDGSDNYAWRAIY